MFERVLTLRPAENVLVGMEKISSFYEVLDEQDLGRTYVDCLTFARGTTKGDLERDGVKNLWLGLLGKFPAERLSSDVDDYYASPQYYRPNEGPGNQFPSGDMLSTVDVEPGGDPYNPDPLAGALLSGDPTRLYAIAATFRTNLYLELASKLHVMYVPDVLRTNYVSYKAHEQLYDFPISYLDAVKELSRVFQKKYGLAPRRLTGSIPALDPSYPTLEFPFFLFYVLENADTPDEVLDCVVELRGSRPARQMREAIVKIELEGSQKEDFAKLRAAISAFEQEWKSRNQRILKKIVSVLSFSPLPWIAFFLFPPAGIPLTLATTVVKTSVDVSVVMEGIARLRERRKYALLEFLARRTEKWDPSSPFDFLRKRVETIWSKPLTERDLQFIAAATPTLRDLT